MNGEEKCKTCERVNPPYGVGKDGCCLDLVGCLEAFAILDEGREADKNAGSH